MDLDDIILGNSNKSINNFLLEKIVAFRNKLLLHPNRDNYFGRIVYDTKNKEFGFIVGPFTSIEPSKKDDKRLLLVTLGVDDFRIRYTQQAFIKYVKGVEIDDISTKTVLQSASYFCNNQCIMECSDQCALFKLKFNKIKND